MLSFRNLLIFSVVAAFLALLFAGPRLGGVPRPGDLDPAGHTDIASEDPAPADSADVATDDPAPAAPADFITADSEVSPPIDVPTAGTALVPPAPDATESPGEARTYTRYLPHVLSSQSLGRTRVAWFGGKTPHNVILFVGDGMGTGHLAAAGAYRNGRPGRLVFERFPHHARVTTTNLSGAVTDSAAAATAMATCVKTLNGVISVALPGDGQPLPTVLEAFQSLGKRTGLVTTSTLTDATPAAFGAHAVDRGDDAGIADHYLSKTRPHVLLGGGSPALAPQAAAAAGYTVVQDLAGLLAVDPAAERVAGLFGDGPMPSAEDGLGALPSLADMTRAALAALEPHPNGFFLLVEEEGTDTFAHLNDLRRTVRAVLELDDAVEVARAWAERRRDTLVVVTADHETGGLTDVRDKGAGRLPAARWTTPNHTDRRVPIFAAGPTAERVVGSLDNTGLAPLLLETPLMPRCGAGSMPSP